MPSAALHRHPPLWVRLPIYLGAGFFTLALLLSAVFDPRIRLLHALQALIYIAVILLVSRSSPWGYGAGFFIACFWNYTNLFVTTFVKYGWNQVLLLIHTGRMTRPDGLIPLIAAGGHFLMIVFCMAGLLLLRPGWRDGLRFVLGGIAAICFFIAIIYGTGRQYIPLVHRIFHLKQPQLTHVAALETAWHPTVQSPRHSADQPTKTSPHSICAL